MADACHASAQISLVRFNRIRKLAKTDAVASRCDENNVVNQTYGFSRLL